MSVKIKKIKNIRPPYFNDGKNGFCASLFLMYFLFYFDQGCSLPKAFGKLVAAEAFMPLCVSNLNYYETDLVINQNYFESQLIVFLM